MRFTPTNNGRGKTKLGKRFRKRILPSVRLQTYTWDYRHTLPKISRLQDHPFLT